MNPAYQGNLPPGYPGSGSNMTTSASGLAGVMPPLAYTHGIYSPVSPTYSVPGSLGASGAVAAPPGGGLLYEGNALPLNRPYGKSSPYIVPATHSPYPTSISSAPAHSQSAYTHSLSQPGSTLYSSQMGYPPGLHPALAPPSSLIQHPHQHQPRQVYIPNGSPVGRQMAMQEATQQAGVNPAQLGLSPAALAARPSPIQTMPGQPQTYHYPMMAAAAAAGAGAPQPPSVAGTAIYPNPAAAYYSTYPLGYQT